MAAKDIFHQHVRRALEKDGWTITDDPLSLRWLGTTLQVDLGCAMDKLEQYRDIIERELTEIVALTEHSSAAPTNLRDKTVFDRQADSYLILREGWDGAHRIHGPVISLEIINGKIWLQADHTNLRIAERLEEAGIPKSEIVLGFQPPQVKPYTEYAVA
ncbi:MAG: element excision factor XisI family protein [Blastocatellales bacterium]